MAAWQRRCRRLRQAAPSPESALACDSMNLASARRAFSPPLSHSTCGRRNRVGQRAGRLAPAASEVATTLSRNTVMHLSTIRRLPPVATTAAAPALLPH